MSGGAWLIVNADDFAYFPEVSRGILRCMTRGIVGATSVLVHRDTPCEELAPLRDLEAVDVGVHLNLSCGVPLTDRLRDHLPEGCFPSRTMAALGVLSGRLPADLVAEEWVAQIGRVRDAGLSPVFLNSHEHLHMLPGLFHRFLALADRFGIRFVRYSTPERSGSGAAGPWLRWLALGAVSLVSRRPSTPASARLLGMAPSGRLDRRYLERILPTLRPGRVYELMCHPGFRPASEPRVEALSQYHDWDGERELLCDPGTAALLAQHQVHPCRFSTSPLTGVGS